MIQLITLFSGIGGPELAAEMLNEKYGREEWIIVASCEIAEFPRKVLEYYWPDTYHHTDIRTLTYETLVEKSNWNPKLPTVIIGGFPCQPFSVAGGRKGADDNRFLWPEMLRVIAEVRPVAVIGENVAGLLSMVQPGGTVRVEGAEDLFSAENSLGGNRLVGKSKKIITKEGRYIIDEICETLEQSGFEVQPVVIPACAVGAPHRRDRIFIVAYTYNNGSHATNTGVKGLQFGRKNRIYKAEFIANNNLRDRKEIRLQTRREKHVYSIERKRIITDSDSQRLKWRWIRKLRLCKKACRRQIKICMRERALANPVCDRRPIKKHREAKSGRIAKESLSSNWSNWPTQSPICSGDDGIPPPMDGITFSKWRNESVKAYGNAIVSQAIMPVMEGLQILINEDYE
ncbi:MAG: hypothetical protein A2W93_14465 [Bacteroidetes bacterium GWF2_43_63]|nr:MAG: hypothetical protein A2W94_01035 [Bacteroidetes bacterium GWE2_42_42]OFY52544.1 MAG: hypothetical protein A2W93_14465 [Bacteroidetes bacterium GWF2_43_63]HBG71452.1 hypothetical protein [Bacteroidales bacterium]HCB60796.1 hypothetical protein [Bacteroidales bacterium]HCY23479.1 hypothetical protein [Bacteroidales bacterium]